MGFVSWNMKNWGSQGQGLPRAGQGEPSFGGVNGGSKKEKLWHGWHIARHSAFAGVQSSVNGVRRVSREEKCLDLDGTLDPLCPARGTGKLDKSRGRKMHLCFWVFRWLRRIGQPAKGGLPWRLWKLARSEAKCSYAAGPGWSSQPRISAGVEEQQRQSHREFSAFGITHPEKYRGRERLILR